MKLKFGNIGLILSRDAQKKIGGGLEEEEELSGKCRDGGQCILYVEAIHSWLAGFCGRATLIGPCQCEAGGFVTNNGGTTCNA